MLDVSRSGYHSWRGRTESRRSQENKKLLKHIRQVHADSYKVYGSPRVTAQLHRQGIVANEKRVARLMQENGLVGRIHSRKGKMPTVNEVIQKSSNKRLVMPEPIKPNQVWVGDVTYLRHQKRWWYLAVIMDLYSRKVVGWSLETYRTTELTKQALHHALKSRAPELGMIFHSDRGSEYGGSRYLGLLDEYGIRASMNRPGHCTDNAHMESFFHSLKGEWLRGKTFEDTASLRNAVRDYIVKFYNRVRLHSGIGYHSPDEYERLTWN